MPENTELICPNCQHENHEGFLFCEICGQKNKPLKITFFGFIKDFFDVVFNLDNRFWKTIRNLFIPGRLTRLFFQGKRKSYYHPLRLYLVAILFLFTALSFLNVDKSILKGNAMDMGGRYKKTKLITNQKGVILKTLDSLKINDSFYSQNGILDSISKELYLIIGKDTIYIDNPEKPDTTSFTFFFKSYSLTDDELFEQDIDEVIENKGITDFVEKLVAKQFIKGSRDLGSFNNYIFANLTWLLIALIPVFSIVLKLFYIRRKRYYMEHFVFLLHLFTGIIFISTFLMIGLIPTEQMSLFTAAMITVVSIYPFLAFKFYYEQGFFKTLIKYFGIGFFCLFGFLITFIIFVLISGVFF